MALSDLAVYSEYAYLTMTEVLQQQIALFNAASGGAIELGVGAHQGDYSDKAFFAKISGLIRRRNAYGTGSVAEKAMTQLVDTMVKIATGTPPVNISPSQFNWIQMNPQVAGVVLGQQLAVDSMADMLNTALGATYAALGQVAAVKTDVTAVASPGDKLSFININTAQSKFGDATSKIICWVMHSKPVFDLYANALTNTEKLFTYATVNVIRDPWGRLILVTDSPNLVTSTTYHTLGLVNGAMVVHQNNDYFANESTLNGTENIQRTFQAEWSYELGIKGFAWDKTNGGKSPTDAALLTATNWDKYSTSNKDIAGVVLETH